MQGTFLLHERLFGEKGHRKEYNSFFTSSDSLKCLTRKTASSAPHLSPQLQLSVNRGQDSSMDILLLLPSKCPGCVDRHSHMEWGLAQSPVSKTSFLACTPSKKNVTVPQINPAHRQHMPQTQQDIIKVSQTEIQNFKTGSCPQEHVGKASSINITNSPPNSATTQFLPRLPK